jgi:type I restriction enzyme S subunit
MRGPVPLAPAAECQEVLKRLSGAIESYSELKKLTLSACSELESLDQSILAKAFRGELVPQDPSDEPASVMLERLRAEWQVAANQYGTQKMMHGRRTAQKGQR